MLGRFTFFLPFCSRLLFPFQMSLPRGLVLFLPQISLLFLDKQLFSLSPDFRHKLQHLPYFCCRFLGRKWRRNMCVIVLPKCCTNLVNVLGGTKWESLPSDIQDGQGQSLLTCLSCCFCHHCSDTCQIKVQQQPVRDEWYIGSQILGAGSPLLKDF